MAEKYDDVKQKTIELYDSLPQEQEARMSRLDVRDQIIDLNYKFFGYVASHTFINNSIVSYEDKFQSALSQFCYCWYWYRWEGHYRMDLSFSVFFKPRISEMIERELNEVKYSVRRSLCMEAGKQLNKPWTQVCYDDLKYVNLPPDKMSALKSIFGVSYIADLEEHEVYLKSPSLNNVTDFNLDSDKYNSIEELLMSEMISQETKLTDNYLKKMSDMYGLDFYTLKSKLPVAEKMLYDKLHHNLDMMMDT